MRAGINPDSPTEEVQPMAEAALAPVPVMTADEAKALLREIGAGPTPEQREDALVLLEGDFPVVSAEARPALPAAAVALSVPVSGLPATASPIHEAFGRWVAQARKIEAMPKTASDDAFAAACDVADAIVVEIARLPAHDMTDFAVKVYLGLFLEYGGTRADILKVELPDPVDGDSDLVVPSARRSCAHPAAEARYNSRATAAHETDAPGLGQARPNRRQTPFRRPLEEGGCSFLSK